jgi:phosphosulfolactate synthase
VGSKNPDDIIPPYKWVKMINNELDAGAWKVICEARESGNVGVFRQNGYVRTGLIDEITDQIPAEKLIFEAPQKEQQVWFIRKFGSNVNLGNIQPMEVIPVETLRLGLRGDTLFDFYSISDEDLNEIYTNNGNPGISQELE